MQTEAPPETPETTNVDTLQTLVMAASTRSGSINRALAREIGERLRERGDDAAFVDLRDHAMPLYDADVEARDGMPAAAEALAGQLAGARALVIVSPEYNGAFSPLLKNTIDWVTRVDVSALAHLTVLVAAASPGQGGGANGAAMVRNWMSNMGVSVGEHTLTVGSVASRDHLVASLDRDELDRFVGQAVAEPAAV